MPTPTKADRQFGDLALRNKLLSKKQVDECLQALEEGDIRAGSLAEAIEQKGLLSARAVASIARALNFREARLESKLYARTVVKNKFCELVDVRACLEEQKKKYLAGEPAPHLGDLLVEKGKLAKDKDKAIRGALAALDKEQHVAREVKAKADALSDDSVDEVVEEKGKKKGPASRAPLSRGGKRPPPSGKKPVVGKGGKGGDAEKKDSEDVEDEKKSSGDDDAKAEKKSDSDDLLKLEDSDIVEEKKKPAGKGKAIPAPSLAAAISEDDDVEPDAELDEALGMKDDLSPPAPDSSSGISVSESRDASEVSPGTALARAAAADEATEREKKKGRDDDTNDNMEPILAPDDLSDLAQLGVEVSPRTIGGGDSAAPSSTPGESSEVKLPERFAGGPEKKAAPALEPIDELKSEKPSSAPSTESLPVRVAAPSAGGRDCPKCKVSLDSETSECIYCGYSFVTGKQSGKAAKSAPAAKVDVPEGVLKQPFAKAFSSPKSLWSGPRGEWLRATSATAKEPRLVYRLPGSLAPAADQMKEFMSESEKVAGLDLRHVLALESVGHDDAGYYLVYEDAPGAPALAKVTAEAVIDRMRAGKLVKEIVAALSETSKAGVFARELRPEQVFLPEEADGSPRIGAFGTARLFEPPATGAPDTDEYTPPERVKKADRADARTEMSGVGAVLKLFLTGSGPTGKEPKELPNVPGGLRTVLMKTLDPVTGKRFVDHARMLEDVEKAPGAKGYEFKVKR